jgi:hypothetical protein
VNDERRKEFVADIFAAVTDATRIALLMNKRNPTRAEASAHAQNLHHAGSVLKITAQCIRAETHPQKERSENK